MPYRTSHKRTDALTPTPYLVWRKHIEGTGLETRIGVMGFVKTLEAKGIGELFYFRREGDLRCKILKPQGIESVKAELFSKPWQSLWSRLLYKLASLLAATRKRQRT